MGKFDGKQSNLEKEGEALGVAWASRIVGGILILGFVWVGYTKFLDFQGITKVILAGITSVVLFLALELIKKARG